MPNVHAPPSDKRFRPEIERILGAARKPAADMGLRQVASLFRWTRLNAVYLSADRPCARAAVSWVVSTPEGCIQP
jgi:hypothetical protein